MFCFESVVRQTSKGNKTQEVRESEGSHHVQHLSPAGSHILVAPQPPCSHHRPGTKSFMHELLKAASDLPFSSGSFCFF